MITHKYNDDISHFIRYNVEQLFEHYGEHIKNDKQLLLLYWQQIDNVEMDKKSISTADWLGNSTEATDIIGARLMNQFVNGEYYY